MKFYIASRLDNIGEVRMVRDELVMAGHEVTYDWTVHGPAFPYGETFTRTVAINEAVGIAGCDAVLALLKGIGGRGLHCEIGMAIGLKKPVYAVGAPPFGADSCAFYYHPEVTLCESIQEATDRAITSHQLTPTVHQVP